MSRETNRIIGAAAQRAINAIQSPSGATLAQRRTAGPVTLSPDSTLQDPVTGEDIHAFFIGFDTIGDPNAIMRRG